VRATELPPEAMAAADTGLPREGMAARPVALRATELPLEVTAVAHPAVPAMGRPQEATVAPPAGLVTRRARAATKVLPDRPGIAPQAARRRVIGPWATNPARRAEPAQGSNQDPSMVPVPPPVPVAGPGTELRCRAGGSMADVNRPARSRAFYFLASSWPSPGFCATSIAISRQPASRSPNSPSSR